MEFQFYEQRGRLWWNGEEVMMKSYKMNTSFSTTLSCFSSSIGSSNLVCFLTLYYSDFVRITVCSSMVKEASWGVSMLAIGQMQQTPPLLFQHCPPVRPFFPSYSSPSRSIPWVLRKSGPLSVHAIRGKRKYPNGMNTHYPFFPFSFFAQNQKNTSLFLLFCHFDFGNEYC